MTKLIVLTLTGNLSQKGYEISLEIGEEGQLPQVQEPGDLPPNSALADKILYHWHDKYRDLVAPYRRRDWRIKPKKIYQDSVNTIKECQKSANELEEMFLQWLDAPGFRQLDRCLRTHLNPNEIGRFLIRSQDTVLQKLPWHAWDIFRTFEVEPSFSVPRLRPGQNLVVPQDKQSVNILAILGHSDGIDIAEDRNLLEKLAPGTHFLVEPDLKEITDQLWQGPWDIIFFAGHSETEGDTGKIYINRDEYLTVEQLWYGLREAVDNGLQVAIFNSCDGLGLAQQLTNDFQIPHLIVMRELVPDQVAHEFLKYFLDAFSGGRPFHLAAREARQRLHGMENQFPCASWLPTIYENPLEKALHWQDFTDYQSENIQPNPKPVRTRPTWKDVRRITAMSLLVTSLVMGIRWLGILELTELMAFDHLIRLRPDESLDPNILIVEATPDDNEKYGYPLSDKVLTEVLRKIRENKPSSIGLNMHRGIPQESENCKANKTCDKEREELIEEFTHSDDFATICTSIQHLGEAFLPPESLSNKQVGFSDLLLDRDNAIRRQLISYRPNYLPYPTKCTAPNSFSFHLVYRFLTGIDEEKIHQLYKKGGHQHVDIERFTQRLYRLDDVDITQNEEWRFGDSVLSRLARNPGGYTKVNGRSNQIVINYRATRQPATTVSIRELLNDEVPSSLFRDRIVIVGTDNNSKSPFHKTPYGDMPAVWVHAHVVSNLIDFTTGKRPLIWFLPKSLEFTALLSISLLFGLIT
ncbi:MAG: CHASE2 domain-containing protein, partial [Leptolyngbya sp. SIO3F4]|nr:CHASE2 domain-containing protein [Leptolyngbya sp. SIO3F4]